MIFTLKDKLVSKLALGQLVAPVMRDQKQRSFKVVDAAGKVVGHVTTAELQEAVAKRAGVELAIQESVMRTFCALKKCGEKLTERQIARGSKYCCHQHATEHRRQPREVLLAKKAECVRKWQATPQGKAKRAAAQRRYNVTPQGKAKRAERRKRYNVTAAAAKVKWRAANPEKIKAQRARELLRRKAKLKGTL